MEELKNNMKPLTTEHPYYELLVNFRKYMREKRQFETSWLLSFCPWENARYHTIMRSTLQVAMAEQLILFGKDPTLILKYELFGETYDKLSENGQRIVMRRYIDFLLSEYDNILFPEKRKLEEAKIAETAQKLDAGITE